MSYISAINRQYHFVIVPTQLLFQDSRSIHPQLLENQPHRLYNYKLTVQKGLQVFSQSRPFLSVQPGFSQQSIVFQANQNMHFYIPVYNPYRQVDFVVKLKSDCLKNEGQFQDIGDFTINSNSLIEQFNCTGDKMFKNSAKITKTISEQKTINFQLKFQLYVDHSRVDIYKSIRQRYPDLLGQRSIRERSDSKSGAGSRKGQNYIGSSIKSGKMVNYVQISKGNQYTARSRLASSIRQKNQLKKSQIFDSQIKDYGFNSNIISPKTSQKSFKFPNYTFKKTQHQINDTNQQISYQRSNLKQPKTLPKSSIQHQTYIQANDNYQINIQTPKNMHQKQKSNTKQSQLIQKNLKDDEGQNPEKMQERLNKKIDINLQSTACKIEKPSFSHMNIQPKVSSFQAIGDKEFQNSKLQMIQEQKSKLKKQSKPKQNSVSKNDQKQAKHGLLSFLVLLMIAAITYLYFSVDRSYFDKNNIYWHNRKTQNKKGKIQ